MPSHSLSRPRLRTRDIWLLLAAAWFGLLLTAAGCRDTREDASFCKSCPAEGSVSTDAGATSSQGSAQTTDSSSIGANMSRASGVSAASLPMSSQPSGMGGVGKGSSGSGASAAGNRASAGSMRDAGVSAGGRDAATGNSGSSGTAEEAGRGAAAKGGSMAPLDAAMVQEPPQRDAGHMEPLPCNGACPPERPVCDESKPTPQCVQCTSEDDHACIGDTTVCDANTRKCVQCTAENLSGCQGEMKACNRTNRCVRCTVDQPTSCPATQQVCENEMRCVECMPGKVDTCPFGRELCSTDGRCIECMDNTRCLDAALARCDRQTNSCVGCENDNDCSERFPGATHCDKATRRCVACTTDGEPTCGPGMFCDANTHTCAPGAPTRMNCSPCKTNPDCAQSPEIAVCVGTNDERYCYQAALGGSCQTGFIPQSVPDHQSTQYCLPVSSSSCAAINSALMGKACKKQDDCGKNGFCVMATGMCSIQCSGPQDCPPPTTCEANLCTKK